jgi:hypothetical protein
VWGADAAQGLPQSPDRRPGRALAGELVWLVPEACPALRRRHTCDTHSSGETLELRVDLALNALDLGARLRLLLLDGAQLCFARL